MDPYPKEDSKSPQIEDTTQTMKFPTMETVFTNCYPDFRYFEGLSPYCMYIPNKEIMFKMMRACITCTDP